MAVAGGKAARAREGAQRTIIKKYANRRLYNTARSSYVTLEDLSHMVRAGEDFAVFDAKTGEDITRSVLTQIIFEEEAKGHNMLPTKFLRSLIRLYGDTLQAVVPSYLDASMDAFAKNQEQMRQAFAKNPALQNFEVLTRSNMELFQQAMKMFAPFAAGMREASAKASDQASQADRAEGQGAAVPEPDIEQMQRQLREMQERLEKLSRDKG